MRALLLLCSGEELWAGRIDGAFEPLAPLPAARLDARFVLANANVWQH
jgi:hypothetical protein